MLLAKVTAVLPKCPPIAFLRTFRPITRPKKMLEHYKTSIYTLEAISKDAMWFLWPRKIKKKVRPAL